MWQPLTDEILREAFNGSELEVVTQLRGQETVDPIPGLLAGVAAHIRGRIRSAGRVSPSGEAGAIPAELRPVATDIVRYQVLLRFALDISEPRQQAWKQACKVLEDISAGRYLLAEDGSSPMASPHMSSRPAYWGPRSKKGGIM